MIRLASCSARPTRPSVLAAAVVLERVFPERVVPEPPRVDRFAAPPLLVPEALRDPPRLLPDLARADPDDDFGAGMDSLLLAGSLARAYPNCVGVLPTYPWVTNSRSAFCAWRRFSACSQMRWREP